MTVRLRFHDGLERFCSGLPEKPVLVDVNPGRGEYSEALLHAFPQAKLSTVRKPPADIYIPYRTVHGIWISDRFISIAPRDMMNELNLFWEWLVPGGIAYFCVLEGEGYKLLQGQGSAARVLQTYYQPQDLEQMVAQAGFLAKDAWRTVMNERPYIHLIIQRPE